MTGFSDYIKEQIKMPDILAAYGTRAEGKRIPCPIHHGTNNNFTFREDSFYCFKCGAKGDIFDFVKLYFGIEFSDAVKKVAADFGIRAPETWRENQKMLEARKAQRRKMEAQKEERQRIEDAYWEAFDLWARCDSILRAARPAAMEAMDEAYAEAVKTIGYAEYQLEFAEDERRAYTPIERRDLKCRTT